MEFCYRDCPSFPLRTAEFFFQISSLFLHNWLERRKMENSTFFGRESPKVSTRIIARKVIIALLLFIVKIKPANTDTASALIWVLAPHTHTYKRIRLKRGTVPQSKMQPRKTDPIFKMPPRGTVPHFKVSSVTKKFLNYEGLLNIFNNMQVFKNSNMQVFKYSIIQ